MAACVDLFRVRTNGSNRYAAQKYHATEHHEAEPFQRSPALPPELRNANPAEALRSAPRILAAHAFLSDTFERLRLPLQLPVQDFLDEFVVSLTPSRRDHGN